MIIETKDQILIKPWKDIIEFNSDLKANQDNLIGFTFVAYGKVVDVDMQSGQILVNNDIIIDPEKTEDKKRWISFRRVRFDLSMNGKKSDDKITYGFGWQSDKKKRIILVNPDGIEIDG